MSPSTFLPEDRNGYIFPKRALPRNFAKTDWGNNTYLLTPWSRALLEKLTGSAASQEIPRIFETRRFLKGTHKRPPAVPIPSQLHPVLTTSTHFLKIHLIIILLSRSGSPQWSPSLRCPNQNPVHPLPSPIRATCSTHLILLDFTTLHKFG